MRTSFPLFFQQREKKSLKIRAVISLIINIQQEFCRIKMENSPIFFRKLFVSSKKVPTFASAIEKQIQIRESKMQKCNNRMARSSIG